MKNLLIVSAIAIIIGGLSLIGVPGTAGFVSKWYLITAVLSEGVLGVALVVVIVLGSLMAVVYIWRIVELAYFSSATTASSQGQVNAPRLLVLVTCIAAAANLYFGLVTEIPTNLATAAAQTLVGMVQ